VVSPEETRFRSRLGLLVLAVTIVRLLAARWIPLTEDEAYYRLWAQHLHLGYYDHPPMIAWWARAGITLAGDNPLGMRLVPVLATGLATWLVADITRSLGAKPETGLRASVWYNATSTIGFGGILATPDAPACLFWVLTLWALAKIWAGGQARWWLAAGLFAGLACISKYSALFLAPGVLLWLLATDRGRRSLATPWPWLAMVVAGLVFATNVLWNAQHGWLTFAKQFGRVAPARFQPGHLIELLLGQLFLLNPMIAIYAGHGVVRAWRERADPRAVHLILPLVTALPFAAYLAIHSLHDRVQAHWPVPLYAGLAIAAAISAEQGAQTRTAKFLRNLMVSAGLALSAAALTYAAFPGSAPVGRFDPILPLRGWPKLASGIVDLRKRQDAAWIGTANYGAYAQLAATRRIDAPMIEVIERARYGDETARPDFSRPGLIVDLGRRLGVSDLRSCFATVVPVGELARGAPGGRALLYTAYRVEGPKVDVLRDGCPNDLGRKPPRP
jgi:4-amino-4-deoxy-L-arabinose transferase-like glycosyltransferase